MSIVWFLGELFIEDKAEITLSIYLMNLIVGY